MVGNNGELFVANFASPTVKEYWKSVTIY